MPIGTTAAILAGAGMGTSVLGSILGSRTKKYTNDTTPVWSNPADYGLQDTMRSKITDTISNPGTYVDPLRVAGTEKINRRYRDMPNTLATTFAQRGYGSSSSLPAAGYRSEYERAGNLTDFDAAIAQLILGEKNSAINQGINLEQLTRGTHSEGTMPGNPAGAGLMTAGNGLENMATLLTLSKVLGGGGGVQSMPLPSAAPPINWDNWGTGYSPVAAPSVSSPLDLIRGGEPWRDTEVFDS